MKDLFFITGLPRSRTSWLANLFCHGDLSFCSHDELQRGLSAEGLLSRLEEKRKMSGVKFVGDSDSGLLLFAGYLAARVPEARWLFVRRPVSDCQASFEKYFAGTGYPGSNLPDTLSKSAFEKCEALYESAKALVPSMLEVKFELLDERSVIERIWQHCLPGKKFPQERWKLLDTFGVNVLVRKI